MCTLSKATTAFLCCLLPLTAPLARPSTLAGPIEGQVLRVVDGDTIRVRISIWIGQNIDVSVRLRGIDAPEMRGRCREERRLARQSRDNLQRLLVNRQVILSRISGGKYFGRVLASAASPEGADLAKAQLDSGFARTYQGNTRKNWCD